MALRQLFILSIVLAIHFDVRPPALAAPFVPARDAQCVAFSPDGKLIATGISGMSNEEFPPRPHPSPRKCGVVQIYDVESGKRLRRVETFGDLTRLRFSPDGKYVAFARVFSTADRLALNTVGVIDIGSGKLTHQFDRCHNFDFSKDGKTIAVLSQTKCVLFAMDTWERGREIAGLANALNVRYAPSGHWIAGVVPVGDRFRIRMCRMSDESIFTETMELDEPFYSFTFSPDGTLIASGHNAGNVLIWQTSTMKPITRLNAGNKAHQQPFFTPDGEVLGVGSQDNGDTVFWHVGTRKELRRYTFQQGTFRTYYRRDAGELVRPEVNPERFVFSPEGSAFLAGCYGGMIRMLSDGRDVRRFGE